MDASDTLELQPAGSPIHPVFGFLCAHEGVSPRFIPVRGVSSLLVVDASVFPTSPALTPVGLIMTVAERAADLILDGADLKRFP